jgi:hypothetical protein
LGFAPKGLTQTLISFAVVIVMFIVFNIVLFREQVFKKRARE